MLIAARFAPGHRRRDDLGRDPRDDRDDVPGAARAGEGDRDLQLRRLRGRLDRPAGRRRPHPGPLAGTGSSSSTSRSASPPACSPCGCSRTRRRSACARAPTCSARVLVTGALMLGVYTIVAGRRARLGLAADARARRRLARAARRSSSRARRPRPTPLLPLRLLRSRNVAGANVIQMLMVGGLFGMFFLGVLYLQRVLGYDAIEIGLAFLPVSLGIGDPLARLLGAARACGSARARCCSPASPDRRAGSPCSRRCRSTARYVTDLLPGDAPARRRRAASRSRRS